jgi:hypothetical protein
MGNIVWIVVGWVFVIAGAGVLVAKITGRTVRGKPASFWLGVLQSVAGLAILAVNHAITDAGFGFLLSVQCLLLVTAVVVAIGEMTAAQRARARAAQTTAVAPIGPVTPEERARKAEAEAAELRAILAEHLHEEVLLGGMNVPLNLRYIDGHHKASDRVVFVHQLMGKPGIGPTSIKGFCSERQASRTFRMDRIVHAADPQTGEIVPDIAGWLRERAHAA